MQPTVPGGFESAHQWPVLKRSVTHGLGETNELIDRLITYEDLSPLPKVRARKWAEKVHRPMDAAVLDAIRRSNATGLPYGDEAWTRRLAKRLDLDLTIRPRGRPRKNAGQANK
jgi:hypothetical protein